jgi:hypothetical protein
MQASVPELMDMSRPKAAKTLELYGCQPGDGSFASNCLLARRLAERGVRFIQLYHAIGTTTASCARNCPAAKEIDRACMALITDLKQRGLLDDTLIVWAGEFGRTPMSQGNKGPIGRDHHNKAMSVWLAGAGVKGGLVLRRRPTTSATPPSTRSPPCTISTRRCSIASASSTTPSASSSRASTRG